MSKDKQIQKHFEEKIEERLEALEKYKNSFPSEIDPSSLRAQDTNGLLEMETHEICEKYGINILQKQFAEAYLAGADKANGFECYVEVYDPDQSVKNWDRKARNNASYLLKHSGVLEYSRDMMEVVGLNHANVDKQLLFLINQFSDLSVKMRAIETYNKMHQRITNVLEVRNIDIIRPQRKTIVIEAVEEAEVIDEKEAG